MTTKSLLWAAMAVAGLVAACGGSVATSTPTAVALPSARISASPSRAASLSPVGSPAASAAASDLITIGLPHIDAALEDLLPSAIGDITLTKLSEPLSSYDAASPSGDKLLYPAWLVTVGKTPDDVNVAVAWDPLQRENFFVHAIKVPGVGASTLISTFADAAGKAGWPVSSKSSLPKPVLEITDPTAPAGGLNVAYVYAKDNVLYVVATDDLSLLIQGLASLP
ncbi:MAG: hypothetical protein ACXWM8_04590 [Candidatus Limnocylindrales bacterium]